MKKYLLWAFAVMAMTSCQETLEERAAREARSYTEKNCPIIITPERIVMDSMTFDAATHTIGYHYRFMGPLDVDSGMKKDEMRELLLGVLRNETTLRVYKDEGYVFEYIYRSQRNPQNILFQAKFTDKDYR
jgi:hypothetical protein